jgi:hypothetical protein
MYSNKKQYLVNLQFMHYGAFVHEHQCSLVHIRETLNIGIYYLNPCLNLLTLLNPHTVNLLPEYHVPDRHCPP